MYVFNGIHKDKGLLIYSFKYIEHYILQIIEFRSGFILRLNNTQIYFEKFRNRQTKASPRADVVKENVSQVVEVARDFRCETSTRCI